MTSDNAHASAAVAMAGLAGSLVDELATYASDSMNGPQVSLAGHLTSIFEAARGNGSTHAGSAQGMEGSYLNLMNGKGRLGTVYGGEGELSRIFLDPF